LFRDGSFAHDRGRRETRTKSDIGDEATLTKPVVAKTREKPARPTKHSRLPTFAAAQREAKRRDAKGEE